MNTKKKALQFMVILSPVVLIACLLVTKYAFTILAEDLQEQILQTVGYNLYLIAGTLQSFIIALLCSFFGYILAEKTNLLKPFYVEKDKLLTTIYITVIGGIVFSLDYWTFGKVIEGLQELSKLATPLYATIAAVLYGGIVEELLLRLFFMSLIVFCMWKMFYKKVEKEEIPMWVYVFANVFAALVFAVGHLPATIAAFGELTPLLFIRCMLLNGVFGVVFGWFYHKYGLQYAIISHAGFHIVSKIIWWIFI